MTQADLVVQNIGGVVIANFSGTCILDETTIAALSKSLLDLVDQQAQRKIMLDFSGIKFLSSAMLGVLIRLQKRATLIKGRVIIFGLRPELHKIFKITRLDKLFEFYDDERKALSSFDPTK